MAKLFAIDPAQQVIEIRALRIYEGASDAQRVIIARQTLGSLKG